MGVQMVDGRGGDQTVVGSLRFRGASVPRPGVCHSNFGGSIGVRRTGRPPSDMTMRIGRDSAR